MALLTVHQGRTKMLSRYLVLDRPLGHFLVDIMQPTGFASPIFLEHSGQMVEPTYLISQQWKYWLDISGIYEFHGYTLCHKVSRLQLSAKIQFLKRKIAIFHRRFMIMGEDRNKNLLKKLKPFLQVKGAVLWQWNVEAHEILRLLYQLIRVLISLSCLVNGTYFSLVNITTRYLKF